MCTATSISSNAVVVEVREGERRKGGGGIARELENLKGHTRINRWGEGGEGIAQGLDNGSCRMIRRGSSKEEKGKGRGVEWRREGRRKSGRKGRIRWRERREGKEGGRERRKDRMKWKKERKERETKEEDGKYSIE